MLTKSVTSEVLVKHMAETVFGKTTKREMDDELTGARRRSVQCTKHQRAFAIGKMASNPLSSGILHHSRGTVKADVMSAHLFFFFKCGYRLNVVCSVVPPLENVVCCNKLKVSVSVHVAMTMTHSLKKDPTCAKHLALRA